MSAWSQRAQSASAFSRRLPCPTQESQSSLHPSLERPSFSRPTLNHPISFCHNHGAAQLPPPSLDPPSHLRPNTEPSSFFFISGLPLVTVLPLSRSGAAKLALSQPGDAELTPSQPGAVELPHFSGSWSLACLTIWGCMITSGRGSARLSLLE